MLFVGIAAVLGAPGMAARAQEPRPEEIIGKAIRAHGGAERLAGLSAFNLKERTVYPDDATWDAQIVVELPGRYRFERTISSGGNSSTTLIVLDGEQGWMKTHDVVTACPSAFIGSFWKYTILYGGPRSVLRLRARHTNPACHFATTGEGTVEGRPAVGLRKKLEGGPDDTWYFDKETGLPLNTEQRTKRSEGEDQAVASQLVVAAEEFWPLLSRFFALRHRTVDAHCRPAAGAPRSGHPRRGTGLAQWAVPPRVELVVERSGGTARKRRIEFRSLLSNHEARS
jgi:hypothetical protein